MRADRLLGILLELGRKRRVTARELAERFEVSVRTIYRDIDALSPDYLITSDRGPEGGYSLMAGYKLPSLPFTMKEAAALTLMGSVVGQKIGLIEGGVFRQAYRKLLSGLSRRKEGEPPPSSSRILIDIEPWNSPPETPRVLAAVRDALDRDLVLRFGYRVAGGKTKRLAAEPYGLCFRSGFWYLVAFCRERGDFRLYRTDRILNPAVSGLTFERDSGFDLEKFWEEELPKRYRERGVEARILFEPSVEAEIRKTRWGGGKISTRPDGRLELSFRTFDLPRLASFVLSFGSRAELLEPASARAEVRKGLIQALEAYR